MRGADRTHARSSRWKPRASETCRIAYGNSSRVRQHRHQRALGEPLRDRSRDAWANPPGRSHRSSTAGSCSCACSACGAHRAEGVELLLQAQHVQCRDPHESGSRRAGTAPNRAPAEATSTSAERVTDVGQTAGRRYAPCRAGCAGERASCSATGKAGADLVLATGELRRQDELLGHVTFKRSSSSSRSCLSAMVQRGGRRLSRQPRTVEQRRTASSLVVQEDRERALVGFAALTRPARLCALHKARRCNRCLGCLETGSATTSSVGAGGATGDELEGVLGGLGLDHHDRDLGLACRVDTSEHAAGHDHVEGGPLWSSS